MTTIASEAPADGVSKALLDAGGTIDQHVVRLLRGEVDDRGKLLGRDRILLARLRGRQDRKRLEALIFDQRLAKLAAPFRDLDQIEDDALLEAEDEIEVAQPDIGVDQDHALAALRERRAEIRGRRRFADAAFARGDDDLTRRHVETAPSV